MGRTWCPYCGLVFYDSHRKDNPIAGTESVHLCEGKAEAIAMEKKYNLTKEDLK